MKKFFNKNISIAVISICILLNINLQATAETVSQKQAKKIAEQFFNASRGLKMAAPKFVYNGKKLTTDRLFTPFYVYNHPSGGFVIISAENKTFPILGYDLTNHFDPNNITPSIKALLSLYARHIEHIRYDSQIPNKAIEAWQNIPQHIADIFAAQEMISTSSLEINNARTQIDNIIDNDDIASSLSATYTPSQWTQLINEEIDKKKDIIVGLITPYEIIPTIIFARKGQMYRFQLDGGNNAYFRLMPSEIISEGQIVALSTIPSSTSILNNEEEPPFTFLNTILTEAKEQTSTQLSPIYSSLTARFIGSGHYTISIPEQAVMARVFALNGSTIFHATYRETDTAIIDISHHPNGFYFAVIYGISGKTYNVKLFR